MYKYLAENKRAIKTKILKRVIICFYKGVVSTCEFEKIDFCYMYIECTIHTYTNLRILSENLKWIRQIVVHMSVFVRIC